MGYRSLVAAGLVSALLGATSASAAFFTVESGRDVRIGFFYSINPDCSSMGAQTVNVIEPPHLGNVDTREGRDFPNFPTVNVRAKCDTRKVPGTEIIYHSTIGLRGDDQVVFEVIGPRGVARRWRAAISVR